MAIGREIEYLALVYIYGMKKEIFEDAPSVPQIAVNNIYLPLISQHSNATHHPTNQ